MSDNYCVVLLLLRPPYAPRLIVLDNPDVVFLICDTKVRHDLASTEYNTRRAMCAAAAEKMGKPSLRDASIHDLESMDCVTYASALMEYVCVEFYTFIINSLKKLLYLVE